MNPLFVEGADNPPVGAGVLADDHRSNLETVQAVQESAHGFYFAGLWDFICIEAQCFCRRRERLHGVECTAQVAGIGQDFYEFGDVDVTLSFDECANANRREIVVGVERLEPSEILRAGVSSLDESRQP